METKKIHVIFGSTASGKSSYALKIAKQLNAEIINADSMQVYRDMSIITAQPTVDFMNGITHHMYGFRAPTMPYSAGEFTRDIYEVIQKILRHGKTPLLVGGTGLYLKLLMEGISQLPKASSSAQNTVAEIIAQDGLYKAYQQLKRLDPEYASTISPTDIQRIRRALEVYFTTSHNISFYKNQPPQAPVFPRERYHVAWLQKPRSQLYSDIDLRFLRMIESGALEEVKHLVNEHGHSNLPRAHGLPELTAYLFGNITLGEAISRAQQVTRNYAKRQITWAKHQLHYDEIVS